MIDFCLQIGKSYENTKGELIKIDCVLPRLPHEPVLYRGNDYCPYTASGIPCRTTFTGDNVASSLLIREVSPDEVEQRKVVPLPKLCTTAWNGDESILPLGSQVDVLAIDPAGRLNHLLDTNPDVSNRTACWIRWWPKGQSRPSFRSCDLVDLDMSEDDYKKLIG